MITKYFTAVTVRMPTTGPAAKISRVFLANLPPRQRAAVKLDLKVLDPATAAEPILTVKYKDGTLVSVDPSSKSTQEMVEAFDRQSRKLQIQESLTE